MKVKPLFDRIVLKQINLDCKSNSGLVLSNNSQEKPLIGEIIAVGDEKTLDKDKKIIVNVGDKVIFSKYAGTPFKFEKNEFIIIRQSDILAILED